ncbi:hypothetical protein FRC18_008318, partial [Serendipita sp. 400]
TSERSDRFTSDVCVSQMSQKLPKESTKERKRPPLLNKKIQIATVITLEYVTVLFHGLLSAKPVVDSPPNPRQENS